MIKKSFTLRVLVISFLLLALPLLVDSFIFFQESYYDAIEEAKSELRSEANFRAFTLLTVQPVRQALLKELIYILDLETTLLHPDTKKMNQVLSEAVHEGGAFHIFVLERKSEADYKIIASSDLSQVNNYFVSYLLLGEAFDKGEGSFIRYSYSAALDDYVPYLYLVQVIKDTETGEHIGAVVAVANIQNQMLSLLGKTGTVHDINFALLNPDGIIFASSDPNLRGKFLYPITKERREEILITKQISPQQLSANPLPVITTRDPPFFEFIFNDQVQIAYRSQLEVAGYSVISYSAKEAFFGAAVRHFLLIYTIYGLILVIGAGVTYWLSLWISRPLRQLSDKMEEVSKGNLGVRFKEEPLGFEINILGSIFNNTIDTLLDNIQRTEDEKVKKETYQRELAIGRSVQRSLLPQQLPQIKGAEFAGIYLPAQDVGGDFYGFLRKKESAGDEYVILSVADAAGRGISSCLYSFSLRSLLRTYATLYHDLGVILSLSNNDFMQDASDTGMFVTLFYGKYSPTKKTLVYYSCGHVPGFVKKADGNFVVLKTSGIAIGLKESGPYTPDAIQLAAGDLVFIYTNGLIELENNQGEAFNEHRVKNLMMQKDWKSSKEFIDAMILAVENFANTKDLPEEIILVAFMVTE